MKKILDGCDDFEDLARRQRDLRGPHPSASASSPAELGAAYGVSGVEPAGVGRRLGPPPRRQAVPRRTPSSTSRSGPTPTATRSPATGCGCRRPASRRRMVLQMLDQLPAGPIMAKVPAHHQGARGRGLGRDREPARPDGLLRRLEGRDRPVPGEDPLGVASATCRSCRGCCAGVYVPDVITILGSRSTSSSETSTGEHSRARARDRLGHHARDQDASSSSRSSRWAR